MPDSQEQNRRDRLARAYQSLEGLCCGDAFGERFFICEEEALSLISQRAVPSPPWIFTDDTMMAISIVSTLEEHAAINQDSLAMSFARSYDYSRGYGPAMHGLLAGIRERRGHWREEAQALFGGQGSFGNGSAMRVAPVGAYFADNLDMVVEQAEKSAVTTHCYARRMEPEPIPWIKLPAGLRRSHCSKQAAESSSCFGQSMRRSVAFETGLTESACRAANKLTQGDWRPYRGRRIAFRAKRSSSGDSVELPTTAPAKRSSITF